MTPRRDRARARARRRRPRTGRSCIRAGGVVIVDDALQRLARARCAPRWSCWPACPAATSPSSARCASSGTAHDAGHRRGRRGPPARARPAGRRRRRARRRGRAGSSTARARPACRRDRIIAVADADGRRRARARRLVVRATSCWSRRRAASSSSGSSTASSRRSADRSRRRDARADPGPAARVRPRRDPDAAVHPAPAALPVRQADPRGGPAEPHGQVGDADDGRPPDHPRRRRASSSSLRWPPQGGVIAPLATLALVGLLGAVDDYLNARTGEGIRVRQKLLWQTVVALFVAWQIQSTYQITGIRVPFVGDVADRPGGLRLLRARSRSWPRRTASTSPTASTASPGGTLAFAFVSFLIIALLNVPAQPQIALLCALIIGALLGFLWFNVHPAQIIMGDAGSLSLGATLAVIALITGQILVLPLIGLIFVIETVSDIIQIGYFKLVGRQARVPDGAAPPPLRAGRLGRGEDHAPVLDRGHPRRACSASPCSWPRSMRSQLTTMTTDRPIDLDALTLDDVRAGALAGRAGDGARARPQRHRARPLPRTTRGPGSRSTTAAPAAELERGDRPARRAARSTLRLGPDVDPASTWAGAALVATSPSITPDYPTTEPRLRAQLQALVARARRRRPRRPGAGREADLFLRLCPAPTIGVTGTKGKTTTSALAHAILAADPLHPAVLGGNIGMPLVERLPELTPDHRVVIELSELQLPTLSRGTTVAVYTNVTSDHLDRHGSRRGVPAGQAPARRARRPGRRARAQPRGPGRRRRTRAWAPRRPCLYRTTVPCRAASGVRRRLDRGRGGGAAAARRRRDRARRARAAGSCPSTSSAIPGAPQRVQRAGRDRRRAPVRRRARRDPARGRGASPASSTGSSRSGSSTASGSSTTPRAPSPTR